MRSIEMVRNDNDIQSSLGWIIRNKGRRGYRRTTIEQFQSGLTLTCSDCFLQPALGTKQLLVIGYVVLGKTGNEGADVITIGRSQGP